MKQRLSWLVDHILAPSPRIISNKQSCAFSSNLYVENKKSCRFRRTFPSRSVACDGIYKFLFVDSVACYGIYNSLFCRFPSHVTESIILCFVDSVTGKRSKNRQL